MAELPQKHRKFKEVIEDIIKLIEQEIFIKALENDEQIP